MSKLGSVSDIEPRKVVGSLDGSPFLAGTSGRVKEALFQDLRESQLSREQVASLLATATGTPWSVAMIDAFVAESKPHRFPAELIPAWVAVLRSRRLLDLLCDAVGLSVADEDDRAFAELGRARLRGDKLAQRLWEKI